MNILQLCKKFPYPSIDGETIAITNLSKALNHWGCDVTLLALNTSKHYFDVNLLPSHYNHYKHIETVDIDNRLNPIHALRYLRTKDSYQLGRFKSAELEKKLVKLLQSHSYDAVIVESAHMAHYIGLIRHHAPEIKLIMKCHNVEHELWSRIAANTRFAPKRWYLEKEAKMMKEVEIQSTNSVDGVIFLSERDKRIFESQGFDNRNIINPSSLQLDLYDRPTKPKDLRKFSIGFIGSLDWIPNVEGLKWFLDNVWPLVRKKLPYAEFHVAGRNPGNDFYSQESRKVFIHGEVRSAIDFMSDHDVLVVPLLSGSGIRIKILEALALGRTVITTSLGVEGIDAKHGEHLLIADDATAFAKNLQFCAMDEELHTKLSENGKAFIRKNYDVLSQTRSLLKFINPYYPNLDPNKAVRNNPQHSSIDTSS